MVNKQNLLPISASTDVVLRRLLTTYKNLRNVATVDLDEKYSKSSSRHLLFVTSALGPCKAHHTLVIETTVFKRSKTEYDINQRNTTSAAQRLC